MRIMRVIQRCETSMDTEELVVDDGREGEAVEGAVECVVDVHPALLERTHALVAETALPVRLHLPIHVRELMVTSEKENFGLGEERGEEEGRWKELER